MYFLIDSMKSVLVSLRDLWSFMCRTKTLISSEESILPYTDMSQQKILSSFFFLGFITNICIHKYLQIKYSCLLLQATLL